MGKLTSKDQLKKLIDAIEFAIKTKDETAKTIADANDDQAMLTAFTNFFEAFGYVESEFNKYQEVRADELEAIEASIEKSDGNGMWGNLLRTEGYQFKK